MKFRVKNSYSKYHYQLKIEDVLDACANLLLDLYPKKEGESDYTHFKRIFISDDPFLNTDEVMDDADVDRLLLFIKEFISNKIINRISIVGLDGCLLHDKSKHTIYVRSNCRFDNKKLGDIINKSIPISIVLDELFSLANDSVRSLKDRIKALFRNNCRVVVFADSDGLITAYPLLIDKLSNYVCVPREIDELQFGTLEDFGYDFDVNDVCDVNNNEGKFIGYKIGHLMFPSQNVDTFVLEDYKGEYQWTMLRKVYSSYVKEKDLTDEQTQFLNSSKKNAFIKILNNLKNNLYLPYEYHVQDEYAKYFEKVYSIRNLKHVEGHQYFCGSDTNDQLVLGLYTEEKIGSNYNLLHWISKSANQVKHMHSDSHEIGNFPFVWVLKGVYSFYFIRRYYEDLVGEALRTINCEYVINSHVSSAQGDYEVDGFVRVGSRLIVIEMKTRLSEITMENAIVKFQRLHNVLEETCPNLHVEYYTIAQFCDKLSDTSKYYIPKKAVKHCSTLNMDSYAYTLKLPQQQQVKINFLTSPTYSGLVRKLKSICQ